MRVRPVNQALVGVLHVFGPTLLLTAVALGAGAVFRPNTANGSVPFGGVAEPAPAPPDQPRESERAAETRPEAPSTKRVEVGHTWYRPDVWATAVNPECKLLLLTHAFEVA